MRPVRLSLAPVVLGVVALSMACLQGARAPQVAPRGTLSPDDGEASLSRAEGPFGIVFASPKGATTDPSEVTLVFNRPMRPLDLAGQEATPPIRMTPAAPGHWIWVGTSGLSFNPEGHLAHATAFTVEVPAGTRALDGSALDKPFVLRFTTARPKLEYAAAADHGRDDLGPTSTFTLRFNQPVTDAEVLRAVTLRTTKAKGGGKRPQKPAEAQAPDESPVPFDVKRPEPKNEQLVEIAPRAPLPLDTALVVRSDTTLRGREGPLPADAEQTFQFRTYGPLAVRGVSCDNDMPNGRCAPTSGINLDLTNAVKFADIKKNLRIDPPLKIRFPEWLSDDVPHLGVPIYARFVPGRSYRISLSAIRDEHGQSLPRPFSTTLVFDDLWPTAAIGLVGRLLEPSASRGIPVASINVKDYELATSPLDEAGVFSMMADTSHDRLDDVARMRGGKSIEVQPAAAKNRPTSRLSSPTRCSAARIAAAPSPSRSGTWIGPAPRARAPSRSPWWCS